MTPRRELEQAGAEQDAILLLEASQEAFSVRRLGEPPEARVTTVTLAVRHGDEILGIDEIRASHLIGPATWVGRSWPLEGSARGPASIAVRIPELVVSGLQYRPAGGQAPRRHRATIRRR
jgi:DNA-binding IclR family transcriptional regulator